MTVRRQAVKKPGSNREDASTALKRLVRCRDRGGQGGKLPNPGAARRARPQA